MNPQSWNAYAYVVGNPLNAVDPSGMWNWGLGNCYYNTVAAYVDGQFQGYDTQFLGCFDFPNFGNGLRTGGGRSAGGARKAKPPKIDCSHAPPMPPTPREANVDANELAVRIAAQEQQAALLAAARAGQAGAADNGFSFWISKIPPYAAWDYKTNLDLSTRPSAISTLVQLAISSAWPCMCVRGVRGQRHMAPLRSRSRKKGSRTRGGTRLCTSGLQAQVILQGRQRTITECLSMATKPAVSRTKRLLLGMAMRPGRKRVECCHSSSGGGPNCGS